MALTANPDLITAFSSQTPHNEIVRPAQLASEWTKVIAVNDTLTADNGGSDINAPLTEIADQFRWAKVHGLGTQLVVIFGYDDGASVITDPVLQVFGRNDSNDIPMRLINKGEAWDITMVTAAADDGDTDVEDGTLRYTGVDANAHVLDLMGCNEFIVGIKTAYAATAAGTNSCVWGRVI